MNRSESKYFATAVRMDKAFLELIEKKDFAYITVKEVCEKAGVNRSTFYLHYETLGDLLAESAQYIKENKRVFLATIAHASILQMDRAYQKLNTHVLTPILNRYQVPINAQKYMMQFYMNGLMAIIKEWLKDDCKDSIEHIVSVIQLCIKKY